MTRRCRLFGHRWVVGSFIRHLGQDRVTGWVCSRRTCPGMTPGATRPSRRTP